MATRISNETKIGIFVTLAIVLLILGYNYLAGNDVFTSRNIFYARYSNVDGLAESNPVKIKGMKVGAVAKMQYVPSRDVIVVKFNIDSDIRIPRGSVARIVSEDLLGSKAIVIELSQSRDYYRNNDTMVSDLQESLSSSVRAEILPVKEKAEALLKTLDSVVTAVNTVLNRETQRRLVASIRSIQSTLENVNRSSESFDLLLRNNTSRLDRILANVESITGNLRTNDKQITQILSNLESITDSVKRADVAKTFAAANSVLERTNAVVTKIEKGEGSLGLLVNDQKLYTDLDSATKSLDALLTDLKNNPGRYVRISVFGRKDKP